MKKIFLFIILFYVGLVLFMPKINLYYTLENLLQKEHLILEEEVIKDRWFDLDMKGVSVFYEGIASVDVKEIKITPWIFYNHVIATDVTMAKALQKMFHFSASKVELRYSLLDYKNILLKADGDFGVLSGKVDLFAQKMIIIVEPSARFKKSDMMRYFKKTEEGWTYESKF